MSYSIDANLMVYASAAQSPFHRRAREFLQVCRSGPEVLCLCWPTVMGYLRLVTNPAILSNPLPPQRAMDNVEALLRLPHTRVITEQEGFWEVYREVTHGLAVRGNLVPDAHVAAILRQHEVKTLYTNDADFRRFPFLEVRNPVA